MNYEVADNFLDNPVYILAKQWNGKKFGNCAEWKNYLIKEFPDIVCRHYYAVKEFGHWECQIQDNIWTDANYRLTGVVRVWIK